MQAMGYGMAIAGKGFLPARRFFRRGGKGEIFQTSGSIRPILWENGFIQSALAGLGNAEIKVEKGLGISLHVYHRASVSVFRPSLADIVFAKIVV